MQLHVETIAKMRIETKPLLNIYKLTRQHSRQIRLIAEDVVASISALSSDTRANNTSRRRVDPHIQTKHFRLFLLFWATYSVGIFLQKQFFNNRLSIMCRNKRTVDESTFHYTCKQVSAVANLLRYILAAFVGVIWLFSREGHDF